VNQADEREERVVFEAEVAVHGLCAGRDAAGTHGDLLPLFDDLCKQVGSLQPKLWLNCTGSDTLSVSGQLRSEGCAYSELQWMRDSD